MRDLVCDERDPMLFRDLGVKRSTAASWIRRGPRPVVSAEVLAMDQQELQAEILPSSAGSGSSLPSSA
ncbi:MAG: hypothetical protein WCG85_21610 [Polyangia bacterium]